MFFASPPPHLQADAMSRLTQKWGDFTGALIRLTKLASPLLRHVPVCASAEPVLANTCCDRHRNASSKPSQLLGRGRDVQKCQDMEVALNWSDVKA